MASKLLIVESPTKAKTIGKYLGKEYEVLASVGHVRDLPKSDKEAIDIKAGFVPHYVIPAEKREVIERIKKAAAKADAIYLATDPDREGEAIAWHLAEVIAAGKKPVKRVTYHEITKTAIEEALATPRDIDQHLRQAQEARRVLDRIVGYELSGLVWKKVRYGLSAGRVQSPALRILAERERDIKAFIPETYFILSGSFSTKEGDFIAVCVEEPKTKEEAERIVAEGKKATWSIADVIEREEERAPRPPFTTSTLQQTASTRLGFAPSRTMRAAQKLYEAGHITYMRTDSVSLAKEAVAAACAAIEAEFGKDYVEARVYKTASKNAQEAHEAVRPTNAALTHAGNTPDETALYELIRTRTLASQMKSARALRTTIKVKADAEIPLFSVTGSRLTFPGWLALDTRARGEDTELPKVQKDQSATLVTLHAEEKQTEPPNRYTEAGLIKELEKRGIGRPSTYASIMKTIQDRGYVEKQGRTLMPTATGMVVSGWLEENFATYISDSFTAEMENELDEIARGEREYRKTLDAFYTPFAKEVAAKETLPKATSLGEVSNEFPCPLCASPMEFKLGRGGIFMSCKRYPECTGARREDGIVMEPDKPIGTHPETGLPIYVRTGRFGPYVEMPLSAEPEKKEEPEEKPKGKKGKKPKKPKVEAKRASIPAGIDPVHVTLADAVRFLSLPRELGTHPTSSKPVLANTGRFGPYIAHDGEFRSIKKGGDPYTITFDDALALLAEPKRPPRGVDIVREIGKHPKTGRSLVLYKSKQGNFLKKGLRRIYIPNTVDPETLTPIEAAEYLK